MNVFLKAVGQIDEELLERYDNIEKSLVPKRKRTRVLRIAALAACLCLIFASVFAVLELASGDTLPTYSGVPTESGDIPTQSGISGESGEASQTVHPESSVPPDDPPAELGAIYSGEPLWLNPSTAGTAQGGNGTAEEMPPPCYLFEMGMSAIGRVTEVSPDLYTRIGAQASERRYRVALVEVSEAVYGKNIPEKLYIMIPSNLDVDALLNYEEILFVFRQKGFENYILANETKKRAEAFPMMCETVSRYSEFCFAPFTDGVLDISLWREKGWNHNFYGLNGFEEKYMLEFFEDSSQYLLQIGCTLEQAKEKIKNQISDMRYPPFDSVLTLDVFVNNEAKAVLEYCTPFKNGIFAQDAVVHNSSAIFFERYIYGFPTNEVIRIRQSDENATYYGERFTEEEIERLPNIADFFEKTDIYSLSPMHTDIGDKHTVSKPMLSGNYVKLGGKIYSIARIAWKIVDDRNWYCLDDSYFLISEDGSATLIEREDLRAIVGDEFVTSFKYNVFQEEVEILA